MKIEIYIRAKVNSLFIPLVRKNKCEICDSAENLQVHHIKPFAIMLEETLKDLNLDYKKTIEEYAEIEVKNITNIVLGKHLEENYLTLCKECHKKQHEEGFYKTTDKHELYYEDLKTKQEYKKELYINNVIIPYLESIVDKKLFKDDQRELINIIKYKADGKEKRSYSYLNKYLDLNKLNYKIMPKRSSKARYWIVIKINQ